MLKQMKQTSLQRTFQGFLQYSRMCIAKIYLFIFFSQQKHQISKSRYIYIYTFSMSLSDLKPPWGSFLCRFLFSCFLPTIIFLKFFFSAVLFAQREREKKKKHRYLVILLPKLQVIREVNVKKLQSRLVKILKLCEFMSFFAANGLKMLLIKNVLHSKNKNSFQKTFS